ncbi:hypothetical protein C4J89_0302 [Pseudomonas sp. R4-35-07]|nr:hypothetical protein C4J89_0302 [Pseudomonas sp. R4-35-07]
MTVAVLNLDGTAVTLKCFGVEQDASQIINTQLFTEYLQYLLWNG